MRALLLALALPAACVPSRTAGPPQERSAEPLIVLAPDGSVALGARTFDLDDDAERATLLRAVRVRTESRSDDLVVAARAGTPFATVRALMEAFEAAGIESYRIELNR